LLLVRHGRDDGLAEEVDRQVPDRRANPERVDPIRVKVLVSKEGLDDGRQPGWVRKDKKSGQSLDSPAMLSA